MKCPRCDVEMVDGIAIEPGNYRGRSIAYCNPTIKAENVRTIPCLKCPKCGHSDDGKDNNGKWL